MKLIIALMAALLIAASASAEALNVRSGEHAEFSRLVVQLKGADWSVKQTGREVVLRYTDYYEGFSVTGVFDRKIDHFSGGIIVGEYFAFLNRFANDAVK